MEQRAQYIEISGTNIAQDMRLRTVRYNDLVSFYDNIFEDLNKMQGNQYSINITIDIGGHKTTMGYDKYDRDVQRVKEYIREAIHEGRLF